MTRERKVKLSTRRMNTYKKNAEILQFFRRNPVIAAEELLGIRLMDSQKWILQQSWNGKYNIWTCSRN